MKVLFFTAKKILPLGFTKKTAELVKIKKVSDLEKYKGAADDEAFLDVSGIPPAALKKIQALVNDEAGKANEDRPGWKAPKLPAGKFEGWSSIRSGTTANFFFLFVSLSGKTNLRSRLSESDIRTVKNRLRDFLQQRLLEAAPLLWMETESNCLFLIPPRAANGQAAVTASLLMIMGTPLMSIEKLGLSIPVDITFALHYGSTIFRAPGKTGTVVSDAVNYVFHLGAKHAEAGRLTVSADVPPAAIPEGLTDLFADAGEYEGIPVIHSRRFTYSE
ncbi:MAG: hypothetical protein LBN21_00310 [Treponema sp.]|jgi:hypothetical protein|nr:hypothetical protein [Treponema sp.]